MASRVLRISVPFHADFHLMQPKVSFSDPQPQMNESADSGMRDQSPLSCGDTFAWQLEPGDYLARRGNGRFARFGPEADPARAYEHRIVDADEGEEVAQQA